MSLGVTEFVMSRLKADAGVQGIVGGRMFPIGTLRDTTYPFLIVEREDVTPEEWTKDGGEGDRVTVAVTSFSPRYGESISAAEAVRECLDGATGTFAGSRVEECRLESAQEALSEEGIYTQDLLFTLIITQL